MRTTELPRDRTSPVLTVTPTESTLGAVVTGVDLGRLDERTWSQIETAFHQFALLVFPGQSLSDDEQRNFGRRFGDVDQRIERAVDDLVDVPTRIGPDGWIAIPSDSMTCALGGVPEGHADGPSRPTLQDASLLSALVVPRTGGETEFADLRASYDVLPCAKRERFDSLVELLTFAGPPPRILCHRWQVGDIVVWNNRCVVHWVRGWDSREARVMRHTRIAVDAPGEVGVAGLSVSPSAP